MNVSLSLKATLALLFGAILMLAGCGEDKTRFMVAAANKHAAQAAADILKKGGSAIDAAITTQLVLTLVEPQSSGIGGGAYLMHWDQGMRKISAYDGRETAPRAASRKLFLRADGQPMKFFEAVVGGRAVGAPGVIKMLWQAHQAHGKLPWRDLFQPAIALAEKGFAVSPMLNRRIRQHANYLQHPTAQSYFFKPDAKDATKSIPLPVGHILKNPAYARTLRVIAKQGPDGFYKGEVAEAIIDTVRSHSNAGLLTLDDLANYKAISRTAICAPYRAYKICGMPPSTSGGITVLQILKMLEPFSMDKFKPGSVMAVHLISEATKLAYADRNLYIGDTDFVKVPVQGLIDARYLKNRARLIHPQIASTTPLPGTPPGAPEKKQAIGKTLSQPATTHFSIVDGHGNAVSMTSSVENAFGAHIMAGGFILNNQLTDFSFRPNRHDGTPIANAVAGGKRPRSSMSPTLVFDKTGNLFATLGSPGGKTIITFVAKTLVALLDWKMDMQSAINLPHHVSPSGPIALEYDTPLLALSAKLSALGHGVSIRRLISGLHGIRVTKDGQLDGGADPRREGVVISDAF